jgi:hypothetical protein
MDRFIPPSHRFVRVTISRRKLIGIVAWKPLCLETMRRKRHPPVGGPSFLVLPS